MSARRLRHSPERARQWARLLITSGCAVLAASCAPTGLANSIELDVGGARVQIEFEGDSFRTGAETLTAWVRRSAMIVTGYYDRFPVRAVAVRIVAVAGSAVRGGRADAWSAPTDVPTVRVSVGSDVSDADLSRDWVMVHEMTHLALPDVGRTHAWLSEGIATYVEGIARVQGGNMTAAELWREYVAEMPKGLPAPGDAGLDRTHTWARTYWGGALFCLVADVSIRERTGNRLGLQDALRVVARESGGMTATWPIEQVLRTADAATGTTVLADLYAAMRNQPRAPDLPDLWRRLGIEAADGDVALRSGTAEAAIREAIAHPPSATPTAGE